MNVSHLNIGILHSLIGKNDGVSIVIDQSVEAMVKYMDIPLGNIYYLAAHCSQRFNAQTNDIFWHKSPLHKRIIKYFCEKPPCWLEGEILDNAMEAKQIISDFIEKNEIDLLIAHNTSHPYNFITAVGLGMYLEERRAGGYIWPKVVAWWHDSFFERPQFSSPNEVISKYLKYLPGLHNNGIVFINRDQVRIARKYFKPFKQVELKGYFHKHTCVIPNTCDIPWEWKAQNWQDNSRHIAPPADNYNYAFFDDIGLTSKVKELGFTLDQTVVLLQHTRIVPRKKIETAIDFAFRLSFKFKQKKCIALLVSGHSGDEQFEYKEFLKEYFKNKSKEYPEAKVVIVFGEKNILSNRDIIVDRKFYKFAEIPSIVARHGGIGTYFSEIEGFGNNLLEMISGGLPAVINRYPVYKKYIERYGFELPAVNECTLTEELVDEAYEILTNQEKRNGIVHHNLKVLDAKFSHKVIAKKIEPLIKDIFFRR
jgi:glycosyltransferase involved in cell wall biosynthesis